jgi:hypothetical protein
MLMIRRLLVLSILLVLSGPATAQQSLQGVQFLIEARVFAGADASQVLAAPTFRTTAGKPATLNLADTSQAAGFAMTVTPADLGNGKVSLQVTAESAYQGQKVSTRFDLLSGRDTIAPTVALRDATGKWLVDKTGRPLFMRLETSVMSR